MTGRASTGPRGRRGSILKAALTNDASTAASDCILRGSCFRLLIVLGLAVIVAVLAREQLTLSSFSSVDEIVQQLHALCVVGGPRELPRHPQQFLGQKQQRHQFLGGWNHDCSILLPKQPSLNPTKLPMVQQQKPQLPTTKTRPNVRQPTAKPIPQPTQKLTAEPRRKPTATHPAAYGDADQGQFAKVTFQANLP